MDKASWFMLVFVLATIMYFILQGAAGGSIPTVGYLKAFAFAVLITLGLVAVACIPVLIVCYFMNRIPDIDYSIWAATAFTVVGIITEVV